MVFSCHGFTITEQHCEIWCRHDKHDVIVCVMHCRALTWFNSRKLCGFGHEKGLKMLAKNANIWWSKFKIMSFYKVFFLSVRPLSAHSDSHQLHYQGGISQCFVMPAAAQLLHCECRTWCRGWRKRFTTKVATQVAHYHSLSVQEDLVQQAALTGSRDASQRKQIPYCQGICTLGPSPNSNKHNSGGGAEVGGWYNQVCNLCVCVRACVQACVCVCVSMLKWGGQEAKCNAASLRRFSGPTLQSRDSSVQPAVFTSVGWSLENCSVTQPFITSKVQSKYDERHFTLWRLYINPFHKFLMVCGSQMCTAAKPQWHLWTEIINY